MSVEIALSFVEGDRPAYSSCTTDEKRQRAFLGSADGVGVYLLNNDDILTEELINRLPRHDGSKIIHCGGTRLTEGILKQHGITFRQMPYNLVRGNCPNAGRIWASTPQITDYTDYADYADF